MARPVLANLGFILQIAGALTVLPILVGFYLGETQPLISYFITTITFFLLGFLFNALSKREDMDFKSSATLLLSAFFLLGLVGSVPYMYLNTFPGTHVERFTNSYLESISGYTTAGLTLVQDVDSLPQSLVFYRSMTQWIGGIGIIFILLSFFYPGGETLRGIGRMVGLDRLVAGMKLVLSHILILYTLYAAVFVGILYLLGFTNFLDTAALMMSSFSTGGLSPIGDFAEFTNSPAFYVILIAMFMGALNFFVHDKLIRANVRNIFRTEFLVYIGIILFGIGIFFAVSGLPLKDSVFQVFAASTTAGFSTVNIVELNDASKLVLIFLMFVGGMTFSTAGGLKVLRLVMFIKAIPWVMHKLVHNSKDRVTHDGEEVEESDMHIYMLLPGMVLGIIFVSIFIFVLHGFSMSSALFESVSAYSLTGFSTGTINLDTPLTLKWWLLFLFVVGRIEVLVFLIVLMSRKALHRHDQEG